METTEKESRETPQPPIVGVKESGYEFLTGREGHYLRKRSKLFEACVRIELNPDLPEIKESAIWLAPKIPYPIVASCVSFFRAVWAEHGTEAIALLFLEDREWSASAPEQVAGPASLSYSAMKGRRPAGSIHSHGAMRAFHSGTDLRDAEEFDGIHLVVGRLDLSNPEFASALHVNGRQFVMEPKEVVDGLPEPSSEGVWHPWLEKVKTAAPTEQEKGRVNQFEEEDDELWDRLMEY